MICSVSQYLRVSAKEYPNHTALIDEKMRLSFEDVLRAAEKMAFEFHKVGVFKKPMVVYMEKSVNAVIAMLGVALSGNYYTIIDTQMPQNRIDKIIEIYNPCLVIADSNSYDKAVLLDREVVNYDDVQKRELTDNEKAVVRETEGKIIDTDILYVLFTSGSTGVPKGVIITHRSVIDYIEWVSDTFLVNHGSVIGNQAPLYFDNSVLDIYSSIRNGATLHLISRILYSFPVRLLQYIEEQKINTIFWVPTILARIADMNILERFNIDCLNTILFAGEVMPTRQLKAWIRRLPNTTFANLYGPTEITVDCTYYIVDRELEDEESVPIGFSCANSDVIVLNEKNELVKTSEKGELCVRGSSLALGYYNDPEKTKEAFVQNPLNDLYSEKIYRTGDIVHYNERGELVFDGRRDSQIKHSGHRIELGEIEAAVSANSSIKTNCCLHNSDKDEIVLFYVGEIMENDLKRFLETMLPTYMLPNKYIEIEEMPLNLNGKIDRSKLMADL